MTLAPDAVRSMFDRIAPVYDAMNRVMTMGLDLRWRRLAAQSAVRPGDRVLDAACGTGDLAIAAARAGAGSVTGLDFSERMLDRARRKRPELEWIQGDMLALPFEDSSFDAATVGFGVRNVADLGLALRELRRVLRPGGRLMVLDFSTPSAKPLRAIHDLFYFVLMPTVGWAVAWHRDAHHYTADSIRGWVSKERLSEMIRAAGFTEVRYVSLSGGFAAVHFGRAA